VILRQHKPEYAVFISIVTTIILIVFSLGLIDRMIGAISSILKSSNINQTVFYYFAQGNRCFLSDPVYGGHLQRRPGNRHSLQSGAGGENHHSDYGPSDLFGGV
jgi:hypothetical protein